ncbi:hypothetical protein ACTHQ4_10100 [Alkalicoccobacillus gibsonii]|uniref:hypothetical protein n=1 Tax=Alkalicoccobacillus gibsonii TaxID=79881 RepID=UPI003F7C9530
MRVSNVWHVEVNLAGKWNKIFRLHSSELNNDFSFDAIQHSNILENYKGKHLRILALKDEGESFTFFGYLIAEWTISPKELFIPLQLDKYFSEFEDMVS